MTDTHAQIHGSAENPTSILNRPPKHPYTQATRQQTISCKQGLCGNSEAPTIIEQTIQSEEKANFPQPSQFTTQPYQDILNHIMTIYQISLNNFEPSLTFLSLFETSGAFLSLLNLLDPS